MNVDPAAEAAVAYLRTPQAIRERAGAVLARGLDDGLHHFRIDLTRLTPAADLVASITRARFPDLHVPVHSRWRHFDVGGCNRAAELEAALARRSKDERARARIDLAVVSVLLDAGAGQAWRYHEAETREDYGRSEGLAVASFRLFARGVFSADPADPWRADAPALRALTDERLAEGLQVSAGNPLPGIHGRAAVLRGLARALEQAPDLFDKDEPRPGHLLDALRTRAVGRCVAAADLLTAVLTGFGSIWPGRLTLGGVPLGDVWRHPAAGGNGPGADLVPLHKLSQWLTYSLIEPLQSADLDVTALDALTGLAEYRNGGLFVDTGVLVPRYQAVVRETHRPGDEVVVEWRALTVALLDRLAPLVSQQLAPAGRDLPLASILEGGTWVAGRQLADERRRGAAPIVVESDGTVM